MDISHDVTNIAIFRIYTLSPALSASCIHMIVIVVSSKIHSLSLPKIVEI